jgi:hypothetical protein
MSKFRVCWKGEPPPESKTIEAEDAIAAEAIFYEELAEWVDLVSIEAEEEGSDAKPCR